MRPAPILLRNNDMSDALHRAAGTVPLRVMTYNVHGCAGTDGRFDPERIASVIAPYSPDVVALQELDVARRRSGGSHQANLIAECLGMKGHFHPAWLPLPEEQYGDAILTPWTFQLIKGAELPTAASPLAFEPRGALWISVKKGNAVFHVMNTHLGLSNLERRNQVEALLGPDWLSHPDCNSPVIFCGDLNDIPTSRIYRRLRSRMQDAQRTGSFFRARATFPSRLPFLRLDYIFVSPGVSVESVEVCRSPLAKVASDHLPLIADLLIPVSQLGTQGAAQQPHDLLAERTGAPLVEPDPP
jgi:endonuclease/exonuclease/phosphatase family metal-dependent hydrolase